MLKLKAKAILTRAYNLIFFKIIYTINIKKHNFYQKYRILTSKTIIFFLT